ncbi:MAG: PAS domain S-box protein [Planctomycetes bacterium]|nr:PAS domain S-box protein [Planctomycetota bacterium]MCB9900307.1 PAS domain S-box protein [Planctomycetota bacterium]
MRPTALRPSGRSTYPGLWSVVGGCVLLALLCVHFVSLVGARQDRLAQVASWWRDARQQRALMEDIVQWAEGRGELDELLARHGATNLDVLRDPPLLARAPLVYAAHRSLMDRWRDRGRGLADDLASYRAQVGQDGPPLSLLVAKIEDHAKTLRETLVEAQQAAAVLLTQRAEELAQGRALLDGIALIAVLSTALFGLLLVRARSQRRALDASTQALSAFEERYQQMFEQINVPKLLVDPVVGHIVDANRAACAFYGGTLDDLRSLHVTELYAHGPGPSRGSLLAMPSHDEASTTLAQHRLLSGATRDVEVQSAPIRVGTRTLIYSIVRDVTERQRAEVAMRESEARFRTLAENVPGVTYLCRNDGDRFAMLYLNRQVVTLTGIDASEFLGERVWFHDLYHPADAEGVVAEVEDALRHRRPYFLGYRLRHADGAYRWVEEHGQGVYDEHGALRYLQGTLFDVTGRRRAKEALAAEKDRLGVTLRSIADGVVSTNTQGVVEMINEAAERLLGAPARDIVGRPLEACWPVVDDEGRTADAPPLQRWLGAETGTSDTMTVSFRGADQGPTLVHVTGAPIRSLEGQTVGAVVILRDVTEQQRRELEMQRAAKLESVGVLAGGIAHDFNNILAGVIGNLSLARMDVAAESEAAYSLKQAQEAAIRAQNLTRQLLTFAKGGAPMKRLTRLDELIRDTAAFALRGSNVRCEPQIVEGLAAAEVDEGQINQVLHNLVLNAAQAMPDGGVLHVEAHNVLLGAESGLPVKPGLYLEIRVADEGCGIPEDALKRIFDPYFTTKREGTGLGLATSYSIVRRHGGCIAVSSTVGVGTTFCVYLPASDRPLLDAASADPKALDVPAGGGRVLLMDDEATVRDVGGRMLQALGLEPAFAVDGEQALDLYAQAQAAGRPFEVVIMDLTVPGAMGGREATARLLEQDPHARIVVSSGYSNDPVMSDPARYGFTGILRKPYTKDDLNVVVVEQLAARRATSASGVKGEVEA